MLSFGLGGIFRPRKFLWCRGGSFFCCGAHCSSSRGQQVALKIEERGEYSYERLNFTIDQPLRLLEDLST